MNVTILQRDLLQQARDDLRTRYAGYRIRSIEEHWGESCQRSLIEDGVWHGYYENLDVLWEFELTKLSQDYKGPNKLAVSVSPVFDIAFADIYSNVFFIEVYFEGFPEREERPLLWELDGVEEKIWKTTYFYDAALRDL